MKKVISFIRTLRSQSLETRRAVLIAGSFGVTGLIALVWIGSFGSSHVQYTAETTVIEKPSESPFSIIKDSVVEMYGSASKGYDSAINQ